jgi:YggT family protein
MSFIGQLLLLILDIYFWIIIASVIISWLVAFEVVNVKNQQARNLMDLLHRATEPVYRPIRKYVPPIGGIDITPIIVIIGISILQQMVFSLFMTRGF